MGYLGILPLADAVAEDRGERQRPEATPTVVREHGQARDWLYAAEFVSGGGWVYWAAGELSFLGFAQYGA